jgi:hypothetical protein
VAGENESAFPTRPAMTAISFDLTSFPCEIFFLPATKATITMVDSKFGFAQILKAGIFAICSPFSCGFHTHKESFHAAIPLPFSAIKKVTLWRGEREKGGMKMWSDTGKFY